MYFTSGSDRAFEQLMQTRPGADHFDSGEAGAPEDCGTCRFYRPHWKYQFCVYEECPYQPGKRTALDGAVKFQVKGVDDEMAVFRVEKNRGYTVMSNHHLRNKDLSLKAKGLLSQMLSLPEDWDFTLKGLSLINREQIDAIRAAVRELEQAGYIVRSRERDSQGRLRGADYIIYEQPQPVPDLPTLENPTLDNPTQEKPTQEKPTQLCNYYNLACDYHTLDYFCYMEGNGYLVSWCIGHLVSLADAGTYDERFKKWRYDDLPILPQEWQYIIPDDKKKQFDTLRSLMERPDVTGLVCATDAGREGELIFRFVYQMAGCKKPFQRLWISSMEDAAIKDGFAHLKPGTDYDNLYQSALFRAQADWLVGINATRLFSILYHKTLTVGRVQTPTLKMLVDREAKISSFQKEKYHIVQIAAGGMEAVSERMGNADDAKALKAACETAQAVCVSVTREKKTEQPPRLYDLTTLQREANRLFGFTAKQTLDYAQQLYEKKLLT